MLTIHLHLSSRLWINGALPPLLLMPRVVDRECVTFRPWTSQRIVGVQVQPDVPLIHFIIIPHNSCWITCNKTTVCAYHRLHLGCSARCKDGCRTPDHWRVSPGFLSWSCCWCRTLPRILPESWSGTPVWTVYGVLSILDLQQIEC